MNPRIQHIAEMWYLSEGALFQIFGTHDIEENTSMECPFRSGRGKIEYNPALIEKLDDNKLELYLKAEVIRILLKHPYERQPDGCRRTSMSVGSNLVLADNYDFETIGLPKPERYNLPKSESYEWYSFQIEQLELLKEKKQEKNDSKDSQDVNRQGDSRQNADDEVKCISEGKGEGHDGENGDEPVEIQLPDGTIMKLPPKDKSQSDKQVSEKRPTEDRTFSDIEKCEDLSQLWEEDTLRACEVDVAIDEIAASNSWGSLAGNISEMILANTKAKIDYRKVLSGFRASVLSSKRHLTRMRPNRRSGFDNMGSIRRFDTNILVAVDVSGSIDDKTLQHFFSIINRAFKYGIENIDVIQFDTQLKEVEKFQKAQKSIHVLGRGGTSFQPIFDYVEKHAEYDGLLIFTDGCAPKPKKPKNLKCKVAWVCDTIGNYKANKSWMSETGRSCAIQI